MLYVYSNGRPPHGTASLAATLTSQQAYDVSLSLHLPRTPGNLATGNFMIDLALLAPETRPGATTDYIYDTLTTAKNDDDDPSNLGVATAAAAAPTVLAKSRRPAIMTYASPVVGTAHQLGLLPWYVLGWRRESETLDVKMLEGVVFARGAKAVPDRVRVVIEADDKMQFYEVAVRIRARFGGLR